MAFSVGQGSLIKNLQFDRATNAIAAGTGDTTNLAAVDCKNLEAIACVLQMGAITASAVTTLSGQESDEAAANFTDISGLSASIAADDDNGLAIIQAHRPAFSKRYFRAVLTRATANAVVAGGCYVSGGASSTPITQPSTVAVTDTV